MFEKLATAVLRELDPQYRSLVHVGVNAEGKTVTSPSDAIGYVGDDDSLRMVAVHHTTCRRNDLPRKWLEDPDSDFKKTRRAVGDQRNRIAELRATLIVTTNREPPEGLVHDIYAAGHEASIDIEVYTASTIAHFLDTHPRGQWLRREYLGVTQMLLSEELLRELSQECIAAVGLPDAESWIQRDFNKQLAIHALSPVTFVVGESGMGKTVACQQCLEDHVEAGGIGLVITDDVVRTSRTLADAVDTTLRELYQPLGADEGRLALSFASEATPLLVVVEDVNQSASPPSLPTRARHERRERLE
ncbi:ATP-binding protein [Candidatus Palauibacter sp.]|uniref:ATP-binding protein n=1 Tax=Candidatus Palauibacter sp. TaxID=3101350 RepID=UPI003CC63991